MQVVSHPLFAVGKLWQSALGILLWLALSGVLCIGRGVLLHKRQLRPLGYMVEQSNASARLWSWTKISCPMPRPWKR